MAVMYRRPLEDAATAETLLRIFRGARLGGIGAASNGCGAAPGTGSTCGPALGAHRSGGCGSDHSRSQLHAQRGVRRDRPRARVRTIGGVAARTGPGAIRGNPRVGARGRIERGSGGGGHVGGVGHGPGARGRAAAVERGRRIRDGSPASPAPESGGDDAGRSFGRLGRRRDGVCDGGGGTGVARAGERDRLRGDFAAQGASGTQEDLPARGDQVWTQLRGDDRRESRLPRNPAENPASRADLGDGADLRRDGNR